jgi:hypothetical protein
MRNGGDTRNNRAMKTIQRKLTREEYTRKDIQDKINKLTDDFNASQCRTDELTKRYNKVKPNKEDPIDKHYHQLTTNVQDTLHSLQVSDEAKVVLRDMQNLPINEPTGKINIRIRQSRDIKNYNENLTNKENITIKVLEYILHIIFAFICLNDLENAIAKIAQLKIDGKTYTNDLNTQTGIYHLTQDKYITINTPIDNYSFLKGYCNPRNILFYKNSKILHIFIKRCGFKSNTFTRDNKTYKNIKNGRNLEIEVDKELVKLLNKSGRYLSVNKYIKYEETIKVIKNYLNGFTVVKETDTSTITTKANSVNEGDSTGDSTCDSVDDKSSVYETTQEGIPNFKTRHEADEYFAYLCKKREETADKQEKKKLMVQINTIAIICNEFENA